MSADPAHAVYLIGGDMQVRDLQHCSKCGETCNPGTGMTVNGDRFHKDACPVVNHVARAAAGQRLKEARSRALGNSQTPNPGIVEQTQTRIVHV
jgi:hypothetical protein